MKIRGEKSQQGVAAKFPKSLFILYPITRSMDYTYKQYIDEIIHSRGRFNCGEKYHERHHIKPQCLGGKNNEDNLVDLFADEHFIAHKLLALENPDVIGIVRTYSMMAFVKNNTTHERYECTPEEYAEARVLISDTIKQLYANPQNHPCYGKHPSDDTRKKQSVAAKNRLKDPTKNPMYGKRGAANPNYGRKVSDEFRENCRIRMLANNPMRGATGGKNPRAKQVVRISDGKIYECGQYAAEDNNIPYSTFRERCRRGIGFYYNDLGKC